MLLPFVERAICERKLQWAKYLLIASVFSHEPPGYRNHMKNYPTL